MSTKKFNCKVKSWIKLENPYFSPNTQYVTTADLDNDGKSEIIYLHYGKINDKSDILGQNEIWTYQVFKVNYLTKKINKWIKIRKMK